MGVGWRCASTLRAPRVAAPSPLPSPCHPCPTQVHLLCGINVKSLNGLAPKVTYRNIVIAIFMFTRRPIYRNDSVYVESSPDCPLVQTVSEIPSSESNMSGMIMASALPIILIKFRKMYLLFS